ncbi:MAG: hypothetical protein JSW49_01820 [candidate division WOR-3 bacterium]|nr:MAG: hypothetical protein JSW49_01820 [candidate division WOR-3 bacterium]
MEDFRAYLILDKIGSRVRSAVSAVLIVSGFLLQLSTHNILAGMPFIILCVLLNLIRGISVKRVAAADLQWQDVTPQKIKHVLEHCERIKKFRKQNIGCFIALVIAVIFFGGFLFPIFEEISLPFPLIATIVNAFVLFGGLILSGRKSAWMPNSLDIKAEITMNILDSDMIKGDPGLQAMPFLEMGSAAQGTFPNDARVLIKFRDAPDAFIGLQGQISINTVKSRSFPYFYVVIIARPEFGLFKKFKGLKSDLDKLTVEQKKTKEVDVIVLRQTTTKTSGYHTDEKMREYILRQGIRIAKNLR